MDFRLLGGKNVRYIQILEGPNRAAQCFAKGLNSYIGRSGYSLLFPRSGN